MKLIAILAAFFALVPNPSADEEVRISVLSLLRPEKISLECSAELVITDAGGDSVDTQLLPGERLIIQAEGDSLMLCVEAADGTSVELGGCTRCEIAGSGSRTARR